MRFTRWMDHIACRLLSLARPLHCFHVGAVVTVTAVNRGVQISAPGSAFRHTGSTRRHGVAGVAGSCGNSMFNFGGKLCTACPVAAPLPIATSRAPGFQIPHPLHDIAILLTCLLLWVIAILMNGKWYLPVGLTCASLTA